MRSIIRILIWVIKTVIIAVPCILISIIFSRNPQSFESFVKLAELLISWPIVVAFLAMVILTRFKGAIDNLLRNIRSVSFPGGNIQTQAVEPSNADSEDDSIDGTISLTPEMQVLIRGYIEDLQQRVAAYSDQQNELQKQLSDAQYLAYTWKFSCLNMFYIPITKQALLWLSENPSQTKQNFHLMWQSHIPDPTQRETILDVLIRYGMLQVQGTTLSVTEEGDYFLRYIGLKASG